MKNKLAHFYCVLGLSLVFSSASWAMKPQSELTFRELKTALLQSKDGVISTQELETIIERTIRKKNFDINIIAPLFQAMREENTTPTEKIYLAAMNAYILNTPESLEEAALKLLDEMKTNGLSPNLDTYQSFISEYLHQKRINFPFISLVIEKMKKDGITLNAEFYHFMIQSNLKYTLNLTRRPKKLSLTLRIDKSNQFTLYALKHSYLNKVQLPLEVFNVALLSLTKTGYTYNSRLVIETIKDILEQMKISNVQPNIKTYNIIFTTSFTVPSDDFLKYIHELLGDITAPELAPNIASYTSLIRAFSQLGTEESARMAGKVFNVMIHCGIQPDARTYKDLIWAYSKVGTSEFVDKMKFLELEMKANGLYTPYEGDFIRNMVLSAEEKLKTGQNLAQDSFEFDNNSQEELR